LKDQMSQSQTFEKFGDGVVRSWIRNNRIKGERLGIGVNSKILYSRKQLKTLRKIDKGQ
jgi:hypothetical protein